MALLDNAEELLLIAHYPNTTFWITYTFSFIPA